MLFLERVTGASPIVRGGEASLGAGWYGRGGEESFGTIWHGEASGTACSSDSSCASGYRCAGGNVTRLNPALFASPQGDIARPLDFSSAPLSSETAGDSIVLQLWYRDTAAGASGFNLSDALSATLCP